MELESLTKEDAELEGELCTMKYCLSAIQEKLQTLVGKKEAAE
jgi:hypothetical protein